jgi:hypothetical protein
MNAPEKLNEMKHMSIYMEYGHIYKLTHYAYKGKKLPAIRIANNFFIEFICQKLEINLAEVESASTNYY